MLPTRILILLAAAPATVTVLPPAPLGHAEHAIWRTAARAAIHAAIDSAPVTEWAVERIRAMASHIPQIPGCDEPGPVNPIGIQERWRSTAGPQFIPASVDDIDEHLAKAERLDVSWGPDSGPTGLSGPIMSAVAFVAQRGTSICGWRAEQMAELMSVAHLLWMLNEWLYEEFAPPHIRDWDRPRMHVALMTVAAKALRLPDVDLGPDCLIGLPVWGDLPPAGNWPAVVPTAPLREFSVEDNAAWVRSLHERSGGTVLDEKVRRCWEATIKETTGGDGPDEARTMEGPFTFEEIERRFGRGQWRSMGRFPVQQNGDIRPCDDACASGHNAATRPWEKVQCIAADWPMRVAAAFVAALGEHTDWDLWLATDDQFKAYRFAPSCSPELTVVVMRNPHTGEPAYFTMRGFNFGLVSAVHGYLRIPGSTAAMAQRLGACVTAHYFDDFPTCEPHFARDSGQQFLQCLQRVLGFPMSCKKSQSPALSRVFLGLTSDFTHLRQRGFAELYLDSIRAKRYGERIDEILDSSVCTEETAARLTGKLEWALCTRFGRAMLQPLRARAQGKLGFRFVSKAIDLSLRFFKSLLPRLPRRKVRLRGRVFPCVKVWTDAMWEPDSPHPAGIGIVIYVPPSISAGHYRRGRYMHASMQVSEELMRKFVRRKQYIGQLELLAAVAAYTTFPDVLRGRRVIHWIDNTSALAGLIKGYAGAPDSASIVHAFHAFNSALRSDVWFEYVASKANIADLPSRGEFAHLHALGSTSRPCVLPSLDEWLVPAQEWMKRAMPNGKRRRSSSDDGASHGGRRRSYSSRESRSGDTRRGERRVPLATQEDKPVVRNTTWDHMVCDVRTDDYDVYVGRATGGAPRCHETSPEYGINGRWGNEFVLLRDSPTERERVCNANRAAILDNPHMIARVRKHLNGKRLACWCGGRRCHAQDLAEIANCNDEQLRAILCEHAD
jgi:hypothetical protein